MWFPLPNFRPDPYKVSPFQSKMAKVYTLFQTSWQKIANLTPKFSKSIPVLMPKRLRNNTLWGNTYLFSLKGEYPAQDNNPVLRINMLLQCSLHILLVQNLLWPIRVRMLSFRPIRWKSKTNYDLWCTWLFLLLLLLLLQVLNDADVLKLLVKRWQWPNVSTISNPYFFQRVHFNPFISSEYSFAQCIMDKLLIRMQNKTRLS